MKKIICIMLMFCFCLVGFTMGRRSMVLYLNDDEAVFIQRRCGTAYVWVYTFDEEAWAWKEESTKIDEYAMTGINIHFVEPMVFSED